MWICVVDMHQQRNCCFPRYFYRHRFRPTEKAVAHVVTNHQPCKLKVLKMRQQLLMTQKVPTIWETHRHHRIKMTPSTRSHKHRNQPPTRIPSGALTIHAIYEAVSRACFNAPVDLGLAAVKKRVTAGLVRRLGENIQLKRGKLFRTRCDNAWDTSTNVKWLTASGGSISLSGKPKPESPLSDPRRCNASHTSTQPGDNHCHQRCQHDDIIRRCSSGDIAHQH